MIEREYWKTFYKEHKFEEPSPFAQYVLDSIDGDFVELGCGDGRDLYYFLKNGKSGYGVDACVEDIFIIKQVVETYLKENPCPDNVYTRFFWHSIPRETQLEILKWTKKRIFIEARTTKDKPKFLYGKHEINPVDIDQLGNDLTEAGFTVTKYLEGYGMSKYFDEDPHLVRIIAEKA